MDKQQLIDFEKDIETIYTTGIIRGPIHLRNGCEDALIEIFQQIDPVDYVYSTWASHLHALLHGVPPERVKSQILDGRSITLSFPEHNFYTSAIVGGIVPIALGTALSLQRRRSNRRVFAFIGDMTYFTGIVQEVHRYALTHRPPLTIIVEDNGKSVGTPTRAVWNLDAAACIDPDDPILKVYKYDLSFPHSGIGRFISF